jgi:hypothetical protein
LDDELGILNFYCVKNETQKPEITPGFERYRELHDSGKKAFYLKKGCKRKWMNENGTNSSGEHIGSAGINILWPDTNNQNFKDALESVKDPRNPNNNISCIIKYSLEGGITAIWMGDLEKDFMEKIKNDVSLPDTNVLFAPHHGRKTGKIPREWIDVMDPDIIVMGESNYHDADYASYPNHNKIRQNSAGNIILECESAKVHIYVSNENYSVDFLYDENQTSFQYYIGTLLL